MNDEVNDTGERAVDYQCNCDGCLGCDSEEPLTPEQEQALRERDEQSRLDARERAMVEFRACGWVDENDNFYDDMQEAICEHVLQLLDVFVGEGHSGSSAPYAANIFKKLALHEPLAPLTGEDCEWVDVSEYYDYRGEKCYQNKRATHVFKDAEGNAYDIQGIVWYEWDTNDEGEQYKYHFTNRHSRTAVTFPYTPDTEYRDWNQWKWSFEETETAPQQSIE